jgi:NADH-quinone oxidoreductase subunit N
MFVTPNLLQSLQADLLRDCLAFLPELILCGAIVVLLLLRLFKSLDRVHLGGVALVFSLAGVVAALAQWHNWGLESPAGAVDHLTAVATISPVTVAALTQGAGPAVDIFTGLLVYDNFTIFLRMFLLGFAALVIWLSLLTGIPDREDSADFYSLLLGATLGMSLMASANHLLMVYLGVEMASLPSYALAGFLKGRRASSEAALKYVVYGGGASGVMLYGISLLAGKFGTAYLPQLAAAYTTTLSSGGGADLVLLLGTLFILIGVGFKLAAVPFHFWCPDVFEGASAEVAGFLSVASKGAAVALLARVVLVLAGTHPDPHVTRYLVPVLAFFAALTATFGNLAAFGQTNLKRLLAYSTIAHAGYMMMGLATLRADGAEAVLIYLVAYLFMNQGAFAVVAMLRNRTGSEDLNDFRGLIRRAPWLVITLAVCLVSLLGVPPLAGFIAKFQIFQVLYLAGQDYSQGPNPGLGTVLYALLVIGGLNSVLSLFYYVKVLRVMILDKPLDEVEGREPEPLYEPLSWKVYGAVIAVMLLVVGLAWDPLAKAGRQGVDHFVPAQASAGAMARGGEPQP